MKREFVDYYEILGVSSLASSDEVRKAFRMLSRRYHPDVSKEENAEEIYQKITEAYEVLGNEEKRRDYDLNYSYLKKQNNDSKMKSDNQDYTEDDINKLRIIKLKEQMVTVLKKMDVLNKEYEEIRKSFRYENKVDEMEACRDGFIFINNYIAALIKKMEEFNLDKERNLFIEKYNDNKNFINDLNDKLIDGYNDLILSYIDMVDEFIYEASLNDDYYSQSKELQKDIDEFSSEIGLKYKGYSKIQSNLSILKNKVIELQYLPLKKEVIEKINKADKLISIIKEYMDTCIKEKRSYEAYLSGLDKIKEDVSLATNDLNDLLERIPSNENYSGIDSSDVRNKLSEFNEARGILMVKPLRYKLMIKYYEKFCESDYAEIEKLLEEKERLERSCDEKEKIVREKDEMINKLDAECQGFIKEWKDKYNKTVTPFEDAYEEIKKTENIYFEEEKEKINKKRNSELKDIELKYMPYILRIYPDFYPVGTPGLSSEIEVTRLQREGYENLNRHNKVYNDYILSKWDAEDEEINKKYDEMILKLEREKEEAIKPYLDNFLEAKKIFDEKWEEAKKKYYNFIMMAKEEKREAEKVATEAFNELNRIEEEIRKRFKGQEKTYKVKKLLHL